MADRLDSLCTSTLVESVNKENALDMYCLGKTKEIPDLVTKAKRVLNENKYELIKTVDELQAFFSRVPSSLADELFQSLWNTDGDEAKAQPEVELNANAP